MCSTTATLNQVSLISDQSLLSFTTFDISLTCCKILFLQGKAKPVTEPRNRTFWLDLPDWELGVSLIFLCYRNNSTFSAIMPTALWLYQRLLCQWRRFHPVMCLIHYSPRHSLYICCLALCLCTTSLNIHTKSYRVEVTPPFSFASLLKYLPLKIETNWPAWQLGVMKILFIAVTVFAKCSSRGEPLLTTPFSFSCGVLFDPVSWTLTFGPVWNAASESAGRVAAMNTTQTAYRSQQPEVFVACFLTTRGLPKCLFFRGLPPLY